MSLAWVPKFVESMNRILDGDIVRATLEDSVDPLRWVLALTSQTRWTPDKTHGVRTLLKRWATTNDAVYQRSEVEGPVFRALLFIKALGPELCIDPFDEDSLEAKRMARRLRETR